jgi:hypothetical protein
MYRTDMRALFLTLALVACGKSKSTPSASGSAGSSGSASPAAAVAAAPGVVPGNQAPCTVLVKDIEAATNEAEAKLAAGTPQPAIDLLSKITCALDSNQAQDLKDQLARRLNVLARALHDAGRFEDCYATAASQLESTPQTVAGVFEEGAPARLAISDNAERCRRAAEKKRGLFTHGRECKAEKGFAIPEGIAKGAPSCIVLGDVTKEGDALKTCGSVTLVQGKTRTPLSVEGDRANLTYPGVCCHIESMHFAKREQGWAVLVESGGTSCGGGDTALSSQEHVYELSGTTLKLVHRLEVGSP